MKVVILGGTGEVGKQLIKQLVKDERIEKITALVRREIGSSSEKLLYKKIDFTDLLNIDLEKHHIAISALGTTMKNAGNKEEFIKVDYLYNVQFAQLAQRTGVKSFHLVSALGADHQSSIFYNKVKGDTERAIEALEFKSLFIYRPSLLDSERSESRFGERMAILVMRVINPLMIGPLKRYRSIKVQDVAAGIVSRLELAGHETIFSEKI